MWSCYKTKNNCGVSVKKLSDKWFIKKCSQTMENMP